MASSVARMPAAAADEWRHPAHSCHPSPFSTKNLRKVLVRRPPASPSPPRSPPSSPATEAQRRQAQILDRWATRQARGMITTIERQAHEAEISALLSTTSQPVSARAASFLRETSPSPSESSSSAASSASSAHAGGAGIDLPQNVRASSLIQMWRELEAESGLSPTHRPASSGSGNGSTSNAVPVSPSSVGEPSISSDTAFDDAEPFGDDWDSATTAPSEHSVSSSLPDSERGRVENIVRMLSVGSTAQSSAASSWNEDSGPPAVSEHRNGNSLRVRGRRDIEELMIRLEQERRRELDKLAERQAVSRFPQRGRIQSLLRFKFLWRESAAQYQPRAVSRTFELDQLQKGATIVSLRQKFNHKDLHSGSGEPAAESSSSSHAKFTDTSQNSGYTCTADQTTRQKNSYRGQNHGSLDQAADNLNSLQAKFTDTSRDSGYYTCMDDQIAKQKINHRGQNHECLDQTVDNSNNSHGQFSDSPRDLVYTCTAVPFIRQGFKHKGQNDVTAEPAEESSSSLHVQILDNCRDSDITCTAEKFTRQRINHDSSGQPSAESLNSLHIQLCNNSRQPDYTCTTDQFTSDNNQYQEEPSEPSPRDLECTLIEVNLPQSRSEDLEQSQSATGSWDERNLWASNFDWQITTSSTSPSWQCHVVTEELEPYSQQDVRHTDDNWISDSSNSWRTWGVSRQGMLQDFLDKFSDNSEIRELHERRRVTSSLASDFGEKMNKLIMSLVQRQRQRMAGEDEDQFDWRQNDEIHNADQFASASSSLVPLPYQTMHHQECLHDSSFRENSSHQLQEVEVVHDLRSDMAQIHHEVCELRKLVESCMDWQSKLQNSVKHEVSGAVNQSVIIGDSSNWAPIRKGSCCICCEMPVDSLLYRCGHMCTCFKCAHELQWNSGRCPICRAPIVDVVRAYSNS